MTPRLFSQIELVGAITLFLEKRGFKHLNPRQLNAVIEGANTIIAALDQPHRPATPGMGLAAWRACDETGRSSEYMANILSGLSAPLVDEPWPHDPGDFSRCVGLLDAAPDLRKNLLVLTEPRHGPVWNRIAQEWEALEALYREELPSGKCPRLYERLKELTRE